jgi:taurine dioxygenase
VQDLIAKKAHIMKALNDHGCICIKNVDLNEKQMVEFTKGIWDGVIQLPKFLCFNNQDEKYKQVARVGNINLDGTLKDSQK